MADAFSYVIQHSRSLIRYEVSDLEKSAAYSVKRKNPRNKAIGTPKQVLSSSQE